MQGCDGAILIPRCGFMNKISGLSDSGVYRVAYDVKRVRGARVSGDGPKGSREVALPMVSR